MVWYRSKVLAWRINSGHLQGGHDLFRKGISHKKIPLNFAVAKKSGSAFLNSLESPVNFSDPDFLATASQPYRCPLEKNGHGRKEGLCEL
jgi:hypothetical protein